MNEDIKKLAGYIQPQINQGVPMEQIRQTLIQANWDSNLVEQACTYVATNPQAAALITNNPKSYKHQTRNAILWILSGFIILLTDGLLRQFIRAIDLSSSLIVSIISIFGLVGLFMVFVGPIIGIIKLAHRTKN